MSCKGICVSYKATGRYCDNQKRCTVCNVFISWNGSRCPCCGLPLRTRSRNSGGKRNV